MAYPRTPWLRRLALCAVAAVLAGCGAGNSDLRTYIDEVKARPGGRIEPLRQIQPAPTFAYVPGERRSPFMPDAPQRRPSASDSVAGPDPNRPREFLEQFPLDTLRMVGTLDLRGAYYGLLQTNDGLIHRVSIGDYVGQNYGRITGINESQIQVLEIIGDGMGGYLERPAAIALSTN